METSPCFDLNKCLQIWRHELRQQDALSDEACRELEQHLRESMATLQASGTLTEEEAFWVARHRLGSPQALRTEYVKVNPEGVWRRRILWLWLGGLLFEFRGILGDSLLPLWGPMEGFRFLLAVLSLTLTFGPWAVGYALANGRWDLSMPWVEAQLQARFRAAVFLGLVAAIFYLMGHFLNWETRQVSAPYLVLLEALVEAIFVGWWVSLLYPMQSNVNRLATA